ncbi:helix-turn-helix domain-containing protein [Orenia marismortui]|uniref:Helix-turn-helix protein n=1 Tax=Orenia marismortui TaxID=46469 RepID=A0A4R8HQ09_9FIRM|nr:helix-turn-helix domain-containing protein [Orenia marismortui]TDX59011.1 helix-turn-helix protein [Orenia marismortui]
MKDFFVKDYNVKEEVQREQISHDIIKELITKSYNSLPFSLRVNDLKELLPHGETKIYQMLETGEIPAKKLGGRWIVPRDSFLSWYYD